MRQQAIFKIAPCVASRARVTRWSTYFPKKYTEFRKALGVIIKSLYPSTTEDLLYVKIDFHVQLPKSASKKRKAELEGKYCDNNADIDNYVKATLDSCEGYYYQNDKQIVMLRARKFWSNEGRIVFEALSIDEMEKWNGKEGIE